MKAMLKALLVTAVAGLVIGVVVMCRHAQVAPLWSLALPLGASFVGLFLISYLWRDELARFDSEENAKHESAMDHPAASRDAVAPTASPSPTRAGP